MARRILHESQGLEIETAHHRGEWWAGAASRGVWFKSRGRNQLCALRELKIAIEEHHADACRAIGRLVQEIEQRHIEIEPVFEALALAGALAEVQRRGAVQGEEECKS